MKKLVLGIAILAASVTASAQGYIHGNGKPTQQTNCSASRFYVDDTTQAMYIAAAGSPCTWEPAGNPTVFNPSSMIAYGDSITECDNVTTSQCYVYLLSSSLNIAPGYVTNHGKGGAMACDVVNTQMLPVDSPTGSAAQPLRTLMIGTNEAWWYGNGGQTPVPGYESVYDSCLQAAITWLTVPSTYKTAGSTAVAGSTGTCSNDTTYGAMTGIKCTANNSTYHFTVSTNGGPLYIWQRMIDGDVGTGTFTVDGSKAVSFSTASSPAVNTLNAATQAVGLIRIAGLPAGSHTVTFTQTHSGTIATLAVGTPSNKPSSGLPYLEVGNIPNQRDGNLAPSIADYRQHLQADFNQLKDDGLNLAWAPVDKYLQMTTTAGDSFDTQHPNNLGHQELQAAFRHGLNLHAFSGAGSSSGGAPFVTGAPYFATCDGTTDDTVAIQAAMDQNPTIQLPGPVGATGASCLVSRLEVKNVQTKILGNFGAIISNSLSPIFYCDPALGVGGCLLDVENLFGQSNNNGGIIDGSGFGIIRTYNFVDNSPNDTTISTGNAFLDIDIDDSYILNLNLTAKSLSFYATPCTGTLTLAVTNINLSMQANSACNIAITSSVTTYLHGQTTGTLSVSGTTYLFGSLAAASYSLTGVSNGVFSKGGQLVTFGTAQPQKIYSAAGTALPTCNAGAKYTQATVSDATAPTFNGTYTSGGAVPANVMCDGTNWKTY